MSGTTESTPQLANPEENARKNRFWFWVRKIPGTISIILLLIFAKYNNFILATIAACFAIIDRIIN